VLVLRGGTLAGLSPARVQQGDIGIEDGRIAWIGARPLEGTHEYVDCSGAFIVPGNVCGHTHLYSSLARGMPAPARQPLNFLDILHGVWWPLDLALDAESVRLSALSGALDAALSGSTTVVDHHASPNAIDGSLDVVADALDRVGLRGVLCYEVTDRNGKDGARQGLRENERFLRENTRARMRGMVGAHASFTLDDDTLSSLATLAADLDAGVHIHVAEDVADEQDSLQRCGKRTVYRLRDAGVLPDGSLAAHCVHLDEAEIDALRSGHVWIAHNCRSNQNNGVGRAPLMRFVDRAILGTDGIDGDMFAESRTAFFRAREDSLDRTADEFTGMLARGADLVSKLFSEPIGTLQPGAAADLVVLDYDPPTPVHAGNFPWHWMFAMSAGMVKSIMVDGTWVIRDRAFVTVDEEKIRVEARSAATKLWQRMETA
jgi:putative selenium metabolism protein SsnA